MPHGTTNRIPDGRGFGAPRRCVHLDPEPGPAVSPAGPRPLSGVSVLMVDDEDAVRRALTMYLRRQGATVVEAKSYAEAADQLLSRRFDVVVSDVMLGDGSGLTLERICCNIKPPAAFVAITGALESDLDEDVSPRTVFLQKPFALDDLRARVLEALGRMAAAPASEH